MTSTTTPVTRSRAEESEGSQGPRSFAARSAGSGKSALVLAAVSELSADQQRFALILTEAVSELADEIDAPESQVRNLLSRLVHAGLLVALATAVLVLVKLGVDAWLGGLIVAVATLALGSLLMTLGIRRIRRTQLVPARTIETLKEGLT